MIRALAYIRRYGRLAPHRKKSVVDGGRYQERHDHVRPVTFMLR